MISAISGKALTSPVLPWFVFIAATVMVVVVGAALGVVLVKKIKALLKMTK